MVAIYFLFALIALVTYFMVVVDMFKKKVSRGFCGLVFFPATYCHSIKDYSGNNKKLIATLLWSSSLIVLGIRIITIYQANQELRPFNGALSAQLNMNCQIRYDNSYEKGVLKYMINCSPFNADSRSYKNNYDMLRDYKIKFVECILPIYKDTTRLDKNRAVIIGILSPFNTYACFEISNKGEIVTVWDTDKSKRCSE